MRDISNTLWLLLFGAAFWLPRLLSLTGRAKGVVGLALLAAATPFLIWPVMAPLSRPVEIAINLPLMALVGWGLFRQIRDNEPQRGER
jgi:hypothetical protein